METVNGYELNEPNEPANWSPREFNLLSAFAGLMPACGSRVVSAGEHFHNILTNQNGVSALFVTLEGKVGIGIMEGTNAGLLGIKANTSHYNLYLEQNSGEENWKIGVDSNGNLNFYDDAGNVVGRFFDGAPCPGRTDGNFFVQSSMAGAYLGANSYSVSQTDVPTIVLLKSHTNTLGGQVTTVDGEWLSSIQTCGVTSSNTVLTSAEIRVTQVGDANEDVVPSKMEFYTSGPGANPVPAMTLNEKQQAIFGRYMEGTNAGVVGIKANDSDYNLYLEENSGTENWKIGVGLDGDLNFYDEAENIVVKLSDGKILIKSLKTSQTHPAHYQQVYVNTDTGELYRIA